MGLDSKTCCSMLVDFLVGDETDGVVFVFAGGECIPRPTLPFPHSRPAVVDTALVLSSTVLTLGEVHPQLLLLRAARYFIMILVVTVFPAPLSPETKILWSDMSSFVALLSSIIRIIFRKALSATAYTWGVNFSPSPLFAVLPRRLVPVFRLLLLLLVPLEGMIPSASSSPSPFSQYFLIRSSPYVPLTSLNGLSARSIGPVEVYISSMTYRLRRQ